MMCLVIIIIIARLWEGKEGGTSLGEKLKEDGAKSGIKKKLETSGSPETGKAENQNEAVQASKVRDPRLGTRGCLQMQEKIPFTTLKGENNHLPAQPCQVIFKISHKNFPQGNF